MTRCRLILLLSILLAATPAHAGVVTQKNGAAVLEIRFDAERPTLALTDLITVTLTVEGSQALDVFKAPLDLPASASWSLVERSKDARDMIAPGKVRWRLTYRFGPREPGKEVPFRFPEVVFRDGETEKTATWLPISFEVTTRFDPLNLPRPRDITAIEELPPAPAPPDTSWYVWLAGAVLGVGLLAAAMAWVWLRRRALPRTARDQALRELKRLLALNLPSQGRSERFITLLTLLVRQYLERCYKLTARRQTTTEFVQHLDGIAALALDQKQFLTRFLNRAEAVKFAQQLMTPEECLEWARLAREFLEAPTTARSPALL